MEKILVKEDYNYETPTKKINSGMLLSTFNLQFKKKFTYTKLEDL